MKLTIPPKWGIRVFAAWALILTVLALANLLLLTAFVEVGNQPVGSQTRIWLTFVFNVLFSLGFAGSSYGLWRCHKWGRVLFLWTVVIWSGFNIITLFAADLFFAGRPYTAIELTLNGFRYAIGLLISVWYLNLPQVKLLFYDDTPEVLQPKEQ